MTIIRFDIKEVAAFISKRYSTNISKSLAGYGFDTQTGKVLSWKCGREGKPFNVSSSYRMNGYTMYHIDISQYAAAVAKELYSPVEKLTQGLNEFKSVHDYRNDLVPTSEYLMFSNKKQCSQYFKKGTSLGEALARFERRGITLDLDEVILLNPRTMKQITIKSKITTVYSLE